MNEEVSTQTQDQKQKSLKKEKLQEDDIFDLHQPAEPETLEDLGFKSGEFFNPLCDDLT